MNIGERIKRYRKEKRMTQEEVADRAGGYGGIGFKVGKRDAGSYIPGR